MAWCCSSVMASGGKVFPFLQYHSSLCRAMSLRNGVDLHVPTPKWKKACTAHRRRHGRSVAEAASSSVPPIDLTEDNVRRVLDDARTELAQIFDASVGITGEVDLAELDGPYVTLRLRGRFWHKRSTVIERLGQYLKNRIPEILEVDIEDEKQLDDSPENF